MTAGVYAIVNTANGMAYIGSSRIIEVRWSGWRSKLSRGQGGNKPLQLDWSAASGDGFEFRILEEIPSGNEIELSTSESHWIEQYTGRCYNVHANVHRAVPGSRLSRLQRVRLDAGLTVWGLAAKAGVSTNVIHNAESGRRTFGSSVSKLCDALGVDSLKLVSAEEEAAFHEGQMRLEARLRERKAILSRYACRERQTKRAARRPPHEPEGEGT